MNFSVLILTFNEEVNLQECLDSVKDCDDVVVFDSYSIDRTVEIARAAGAQVVQRRFDNYAAQRTAALQDVKYKYDWLLMLDADERVTPELAQEISSVLQNQAEGITLYRMRRKDHFLGKWLRRSSGYPSWFGRLVKLGHIRVEREINEEYHTDGKVGLLEGHLNHFPFNKGVSYWFERHNKYSSMEAVALAQETKNSITVATSLKGVFSADPALRRKILKNIAYRLPFRPFMIFIYLYFFRLGFLDGNPGLKFCVLRSIYEYMIDIKLLEMHDRQGQVLS